MNVKIKNTHEYMINDIKKKESQGRKIQITTSQIVHTALEEFYEKNYKDQSTIKKTKEIFD